MTKGKDAFSFPKGRRESVNLSLRTLNLDLRPNPRGYLMINHHRYEEELPPTHKNKEDIPATNEMNLK